MNNELLNNELLNNELLNNELLNNELLIREMDCTNHCVGSKRKVVDATQGFKKSNIGTDNALMIRCRVTGNKDDDLIEVEVALPTFSSLLQSCCEELQIISDRIYKLRKLPNIVIVFCVLFFLI